MRFGVAALAAAREFPNEPRGWTLAKQFVRAASSIGANVWEADTALTDAEFAYIANIARKEAGETLYWLELARRADLLSAATHSSLARQADELLRVLSTIVRKTQEHIRDSKV